MPQKTKTRKKQPTAKINRGSINKRYLLIFAVVFGVLGTIFLHQSFAATVFNEDFNAQPDGLITSEYTFWNPGARDSKLSDKWEMTSGSLFAATIDGQKTAYSGFPTYVSGTASPTPSATTNNNSAVFRLTSVPSNFGDVSVSFRLYNKQLASTAGTPAVDWDGIHIFLRYQSEESLYYASINRRDGALAVKKKVPGGPSNGGTYYTLASKPTGSYPIPFNTWQDVKATIKTNADNSVTISLYRSGQLLLSVVDNGSVGGAPITNPGKVGIRGDNDEFYFDDFKVDDPTVTSSEPTPTPTTPSDTTAPAVSVTNPGQGAVLSGNATLTSAASDNVGVVKVEYYDGSTLIGAATTSPYAFVWDTSKVSNGTHLLTAKAYDAAQNTSVSTTVTATVQNTTPPPTDTITPLVTINSPMSGVISGKSVSIQAAASDNVVVKKMYLYIDGKLVLSVTGSTLKTTQSMKKSGVHTIQVVATDESGNQGKASVTVTKQ